MEDCLEGKQEEEEEQQEKKEEPNFAELVEIIKSEPDINTRRLKLHYILSNDQTCFFQSPYDNVCHLIGNREFNHQEENLLAGIASMIFYSCPWKVDEKENNGERVPSVFISQERNVLQPTVQFFNWIETELNAIYGDNGLIRDANLVDGVEDKLFLWDSVSGLMHETFGFFVDVLLPYVTDIVCSKEDPKATWMTANGDVLDVDTKETTFTIDEDFTTAMNDMNISPQGNRIDLRVAKHKRNAMKTQLQPEEDFWACLSQLSYGTTSVAQLLKVVVYLNVACLTPVEEVMDIRHDIIRTYCKDNLYPAFLSSRYGTNKSPPDLQDVYAFLSISKVAVSVTLPLLTPTFNEEDSYLKRILANRKHYPLNDEFCPERPIYHLAFGSKGNDWKSLYIPYSEVRILVPFKRDTEKSTEGGAEECDEESQGMAITNFIRLKCKSDKTLIIFHFPDRCTVTLEAVWTPVPCHHKLFRKRKNHLTKCKTLEGSFYFCFNDINENGDDMAFIVSKVTSQSGPCSAGHLCLSLRASNKNEGGKQEGEAIIDFDAAFERTNCPAEQGLSIITMKDAEEKIQKLHQRSIRWDRYRNVVQRYKVTVPEGQQFPEKPNLDKLDAEYKEEIEPFLERSHIGDGHVIYFEEFVFWRTFFYPSEFATLFRSAIPLGKSNVASSGCKGQESPKKKLLKQWSKDRKRKETSMEREDTVQVEPFSSPLSLPDVAPEESSSNFIPLIDVQPLTEDELKKVS